MAIKKTVQSIQHLRNTALTADKQAAIAALSASTLTARDGEIILNRYGSGDNVKTIFAINYVAGGDTEQTGHNVTIFDFDKEALDAITAQIHTIDERVIALSGDPQASTSAETSVEGAKKYTDDKIATLDYSDSAVAGEYVSQVTETDGVIAVTRVELPTVAAISETGKPITAVSETKGAVSAAAGSINAEFVNIADSASAFTSTTVEAALKELDDKVEAAKSATTVANADGSINVTTAASGTDINVNIKSGEHVLAKTGDAGLYTDLDLVKITTGLPAEVKERYQLLATDDSQIGANIDIYKDSSIVSITYITDPADAHYQNLEYVYIDASGNTQTEYVDVSSLVLEAEFASGVGVTNHVAHGVVDPTSETFLTVGANGFKLAGVQNAIDTAISGLDKTDDEAVAGKYVAAIEETDGVVAVKTRADVAAAPLNGYVKGSDSGSVSATDSVNEAIAKLENQIDAVQTEAAASKTLVELSDGTTHLTITSVTDPSNSAMTFTIGESDIASKSDLDTLSGKAVTAVEMTGGTAAITAHTDGTKKITINTDGSQIDLTGYAKGSDSGAVAATDSVNAAVGKLENQIAAAKAEAEAAISGLDATITAETGYYINKVDEVDGKISGTTAALPTVAAISGEGQAITAVSQSLGTVAAQYGDIAAAHVTVADAGNLFTGTTVEAVLAEVDAAYKAADNAIVGDATTSGNTLGKLEDRIEALDADAATYTIRKDTEDLPATVKERYTLVETKDGQSTDKQVTIDIPKDSHIVSITYITNSGDTHYQNLKYEYIDASGNTQTTYVDMSELVLEAEFASGVTVTDHIVHGVVDSTSEKDSQNNAFLTVGADGFKVAGIKAEIAAEIAKLDATAGTQTVAADKHVAVEVVEADGKVTAVTVTESDIASASDLTAEIAARKAVDGVNGDAYTADTNAHYISGASTLFGADQALDTAMYELSGKVNSNEVVQGDGITVDTTGAQTEVSVRHGSVDGQLTDALTFNANGDLAFTGIIDAGTY